MLLDVHGLFLDPYSLCRCLQVPEPERQSDSIEAQQLHALHRGSKVSSRPAAVGSIQPINHGLAILQQLQMTSAWGSLQRDIRPLRPQGPWVGCQRRSGTSVAAIADDNPKVLTIIATLN